MALAPGSKLGSYEVLSLLGAGGMGEVYRARDIRLGREVAIKVLPAERVADADRRQRFAREARAASALDHPSIVTIHEIESADGIDFIVMEYVPGQTLDGLIPKTGMPVREVLRVAIPIADAVAAAHAKGIVHRDLKPANVIVTRAGVVKVLDFGLAKLVADDTDDTGETQTTVSVAAAFSRPGTITGTAGYMSPEQATGGKADARSDIFSFGALLYEMVTGRRAFAGKTVSETLTAVVRDQPRAPSELTAGVPKELERLIQRCLQKGPDRRFQHMSDVKVELNEIKEESDSRPAAAVVQAREHRRLWLAAALATVLLLAAAAWLRFRPREAELPPPRLVKLTVLHGTEMGPTFSPDGGQIVFEWDGEKGDNADIYLQMVGSSEIRRLTSDPAMDAEPSWSPDGRQIAFFRFRPGGPSALSRTPEDLPGTIHVVSPVGGSDRRLSEFLARDSQLSWSPDGRFLAAARFASGPENGSPAAGIHLIPVQGGEPRAITSPGPATFHSQPALSRNGRHLAYASCTTFFSCHIDVVELGPDFVPMAGPPRRLTAQAGGFWTLAWARDGKSLVYGDITSGRLSRAFVAGDRPPEKIEMAGLSVSEPATAASLDRLAFVQRRWRFAIDRLVPGHPPEALLVSSASDVQPDFSPDGRRIAFSSGRAGDGRQIWLAAADGANPSQLTREPGVEQGAPRWSPDGRRIAFDSQDEQGQWDIWMVDVDVGSPSRLTREPGNEHMPSWSRDGRFVYFASDRDGAPDIWRIPAAGGPEERMTRGGGMRPLESADGKTLFFMRKLSKAPLLALPLDGGPERKLLECVPAMGYNLGPGGIYHIACEPGPSGTPVLVLDPATGRDRLLGTAGATAAALTVSPDGKTILYSKIAGEGTDLMMIENFR